MIPNSNQHISKPINKLINRFSTTDICAGLDIYTKSQSLVYILLNWFRGLSFHSFLLNIAFVEIALGFRSSLLFRFLGIRFHASLLLSDFPAISPRIAPLGPHHPFWSASSQRKDASFGDSRGSLSSLISWALARLSVGFCCFDLAFRRKFCDFRGKMKFLLHWSFVLSTSTVLYFILIMSCTCKALCLIFVYIGSCCLFLLIGALSPLIRLFWILQEKKTHPFLM